jgi:phosphate transport system protein
MDSMNTGVRAHFDRDLLRLHESVLQLGLMVRQAAANGIKALEQGDSELAHEVIAGDVAVNRLRYEVERQCYALLATEQPVAGDLRSIISALTVSSDLERIGDHGKRLARSWLRMLETPCRVPIANISRLADLSLDMLDRALRAYAGRDKAEAIAVCEADEQVDAYYKQTFNVLLSYMLEDPRCIGSATQLLAAAHELERIGDRATNIGERVIYSVTGELADRNQ